MTSNIKLFIGDKLVEFDKQPDIYYNWTETDLSNPITTKNSFSKTITIEGTKTNNDIFGHFWNLERYQKYGGDTGMYFNPSYKVPFTLYINGNLFEKGYMKLEKITKTGNHLKYEVGLYGGLGSFLYNLSTKYEDGSVKTLADLTYYNNNDEELDLDFLITKDTVKEAWDNISSASSKWSTINFGSFYTGIPDEIDTNKVLINVSGYPNIIKSEIVSGNTYQTYNGWSLGELGNNLNQYEVKDFRSYLQTPVIRVKSIIDSLCKPINNRGQFDSGYDVVLDRDFFNNDNPYYTNAWLTLPRIPTLNFNIAGSGSTTYVVNDYTFLDRNEPNAKYVSFELPQAISNAGGTVSMTLNPRVWVHNPEDGGQVSISPLNLMKQWLGGNLTWQGEHRHGYAVQVYFTTDNGDTILTGSSVYWYTALDYTGNPFLYSQSGARPMVTGTDVINKVGSWYHMEDGQTGEDPSKFGFLETTGGIVINCDVPASTKYVRVWFKMFSEDETDENVIYQNMNSSSDNHYSFEDIRYSTYNNDWNASLTVTDYGGSSGVDIENNTFYSYKRVTKQALLSTSYSVADWLMSYCKMFGLYIYKDKSEDKIYISTRNNFYNRNKVEDLTGLIDSSKGVTINPLYVDSKFISLTTPLEKSTYSEQYKNAYGVDYGMKKVDTGYDFNPEVKELVKTSLKGAVDCQKQSIYNFKSIDGVNPYVFDGFKQTLYKNGLIYTSDTENPTLEYEIPKRKISSVYKNYTYNSLYPYYDIIQHVCLESDEKPIAGENVLVFYNGMKNVSDAEYYLTDDMTVMSTLNNKPCWVMTKSAYNRGTQFCIPVNSIPFFSRYYISGSTILQSMDFGDVRELYVPDLVNTSGSNLYSKYYSKYYSDLYDVNTKVLECYIKPNKILSEDDMRYFYWFKNSIWRLNKITDYNPLNNGLVKCQFIKVQDLENMTNEDVSTSIRINVVLNSYQIAASGGTISGMVHVTNNGTWRVAGISGATNVSVTPSTGRGDTSISVSIPVYEGFTSRDIKIDFRTDDDSQIVTITQEASVPYFIFTETSTSSVTANVASTSTYSRKNYSTNMPNLTLSYSGCVTGASFMTGTVSASYGENLTLSARTGGVEVKFGNSVVGTFTVEQSANLYMDVTTDYFIPATQSAITYSLSANPGCTLTLYDSNAQVISAVTYSAGYYPSQQITIGVNYGTNQRLFSLICQSDSEEVSPKNYTITQRCFEYYFTFNSSNTSALTKDIVSAQQTISDGYSTNMSGLTVVSNNNWISNVSINSTAITYTVAKYEDTSADRTGSISVKSGSTTVGTITVNQAKADLYFIFTSTNTSLFTATVGSGATYVDGECATNMSAFTFSYDGIVDNGGINASHTHVTASFTANPSDTARSGNLYIKYNGTAVAKMDITQAAASYDFYWNDSQSSVYRPSVSSGTTSLTAAYTTTLSNVTFSAETSAITVTKNGDTAITTTFSTNTSADSRTMRVLALYNNSQIGYLEITQAGKPRTFKWNQNNATAITETVGSAATSSSKAYTTDYTNLSVTYSGCVTSATISNGTVTANFTANPNTSARYGGVQVKSGSVVIGTYGITQEAKNVSNTYYIRLQGANEDINHTFDGYNDTSYVISDYIMYCDTSISTLGNVRYIDISAYDDNSFALDVVGSKENYGDTSCDVTLTIKSRESSCPAYCTIQWSLDNYSDYKVAYDSFYEGYKFEGSISYPVGTTDRTVYIKKITFTDN